MKTVYFVRHGETQANRGHRHQGPHEPLSEHGQKQVAHVAAVLKEKGINTLLSSTYTRARETAAIIGEVVGLPVIPAEAVVEFRRPDSLYGRSHYSVASLKYMLQLHLHREDANWDNEGAENMFDIRNRIADAKRLIESNGGDKIAVVSHAIFMDMFIEQVCADRPITLGEFTKGFMLTKKTPNTAMVEFMVDENAPGGTCKWWFKEIHLPTPLK
jgi:broad specificity phosphatase PhoE